MSLKVLEIQAFPAIARPYKKADGAGLYLEIFPNGSKLWRYKFRIEGKEKRLALGAWPEVSLADARAKRDAARAFKGKRAATVRPVLDALTGIGMARRLKDGRYAA
jgi:hypothetical protein